MAEADWKYLQYNIETGQKRTGDGPSGGASSLSDLDDTSISNPSDGQMLGYDGTAGKWKNVAAPAGSVTDVTLDGNTVVNGQGVAVLTTPNVNDLKDTNISSPSSGQTLQYNATTQKWENTTPASGGNVDDVKVNGTSVVSNKVANITSYKEVTQAQYEALPDTKLSDNILYAIKDGGQAVDGFPPLIYSDEEREVGVWRDGKPLYQKSYHFQGALNQDVLIDSTITQTDNELVNVFGSWAIGNYHYTNSRQASIFETINFLGNTTPHPIVFVNSSGLYYNSNQNNYGFNMYLTVQYTKTTDTPGSGTWNQQGALAHHYSTDEHIVGTWINGKPLYERTFNLTSGIAIGSYAYINVDNSVLIKKYDGFIVRASGKIVDKFNGYLDGNELKMSIRSQGIEYYIPSVFSNIEILFCIIQYTKTTD